MDRFLRLASEALIVFAITMLVVAPLAVPRQAFADNPGVVTPPGGCPNPTQSDCDLYTKLGKTACEDGVGTCENATTGCHCAWDPTQGECVCPQ